MIPSHKGEIPVVLLLFPFLSGIGLGLNLLAGANLNWLSVAFSILSLVFIILNLNYTRFNLYKQRWLGGALITIILFLFGLINVIRYNELNKPNHFSKIPAQYLVVKINKEPVLKNGLLRFTASVEAVVNKRKQSGVTGTLLLTIKDSSAKNLHYGDEVLIPSNYKAIDPPFNPAEFNYKKYLANQNIFYQAFLYPKQYTLLNSNASNRLIAHSLRLRRQLVDKFKLNMRDTNAVAVVSTLILGYRADLSSDVLEAYSKTGTLYVLSVSGAQVAIIYFLLTFAFKFLDRYKYGRLIRAIIIITIIWYYAMLTGFSLSVCRVGVMVSMVIIGKTFSRYVNTLNLLAVSAFLLLLYDPFFITEAGFQISYIAVSGLIVFQPIIYKWSKFKNRWADKIWSLCSVSIAAQVILFPVSVFYFHQFPVYFLISNLFVVIPAAAIMYLGIFYLLLPQIPLVSKLIAFVLEKTSLLMNKGLAVIEHSPYSTIDKLWLNTLEYLLLYVIIISFFFFLYDKKTWLLKLCLVCSLILCFSISLKKIGLSQSNSITWLNLKKHLGIVFKNGNKAIILTDLKPSDKNYQYSIQPYLDSCQVDDAVVYNLNQDINTSYLVKKYGLIQFLNKRIFIFDKLLQNGILPQKLRADYIYMTNNPGARINTINTNFDYQMLIIDGSNSDNLIEVTANQLQNKSIKILKRNNSLISISN